MVGKPPFETGNHGQTKARIRKLDFSFPEGVSLEFCEFVSVCLKSESAERAILEDLETHAWLRKNVDWAEM